MGRKLFTASRSGRITAVSLVAAVAQATCLDIAMTAPARAAVNTTWVASTGSDSNNCARATPCATFAGALAQTLTGGTIACVDSADYGTLVINKSVAIQCAANQAIISAPNASTPGITIVATTGDHVLISGVRIQGLKTGGAGIRIARAADVFIRDSSVVGFRGGGIIIAPSSSAITTTIRDTAILDNITGVNIDTTNAGATTTVRIEGSDTSSNSSIGVNAACGTPAVVRGPGSPGPTFIGITGSRVVSNGTGVQESGCLCVVRLRDSIIDSNGTGLNQLGGVLTTTGTNEIEDNGNPGSTPNNIGQQ